MKIGLIGVGTLGQFLLEELNQQNRIPGYQITAVFDEREQKSNKLAALGSTFSFQTYHHLDDFLQSPVDLIIECANVAVAKKFSKHILHKKDLLLISVGALADVQLYQELGKIAEEKQHKLYLPSGAMGGLDVLRAANLRGGLESVQLITKKPAHAFSMQEIDRDTVVFDGSAKDAIANYPENANIAIIISLAGIGVEDTKVQMIAVPAVDQNTHHLKAQGDFGKLMLTLENHPIPDNPKTSYLTALSILSALKSLQEHIVIG